MMSQSTRLFTYKFIVLILVAGFLWSGSATAANCERKPDHPQCGGGGPGGDDACLTSLTFPTFVYWNGQGEANQTELTLSDADGACTIPLTAFDNGGSITGKTAFHYDPSSRWGRIIWTNKLVGSQLLLVEFMVNTGNAVTVLEDSIILAEGRWGGEDGTIGHPDIAPDGDTFAFRYHWPVLEGASEHSGYTIFTASIDGCLTQPWGFDSSNRAGCADTLFDAISYGPVTSGAFYWNDLAFSHDASKIYLRQFINALGGGTYYLEQIDGAWGGLNYAPQLPFPGVTAMKDFDDGRESREILANASNSEENPCGELLVIDVEDCLDLGLCSDSIVGATVLGHRFSWLQDGRLVYQDRIYKRMGKNYSCKTGDITISNPFDLSPIPINLFGGWEPLGWD